MLQLFCNKKIPLKLISILASRRYETEGEIKESTKLIVNAADEEMRDMPPFYMFHCIMEGKKDGCDRRLVSTMTFDSGYRITGIISAAAAAMILQGKGKNGCRMLSDGFETEEIMSVLKAQGIKPSRSITEKETGSL